jgi:hypothetical protein
MTAVTLQPRDTASVRSVRPEVVTDLLWLYATAQDRIEHIRVHVAPFRMIVVFFTLDNEYSTRVNAPRQVDDSDSSEDPLRSLCGRMIQASSVMPGWQVRC